MSDILFMFDVNFIIDSEMFEKCTEFAEKSVETSLDKYARRNQFNKEKIIKDIRNGKIGEEIVYRSLIKNYPNLTAPDYEIYQKQDKSWDPDLRDLDSGIRIGVKSQDIESAIHFGESWVFQFNYGKSYDCDTGVFKEEDENHYIAFCSLNIPKKTGMIRGIVLVKWLHQNGLFKEMKKVSLQGNKVAIYYEDLEKFGNQLWRLKA